MTDDDKPALWVGHIRAVGPDIDAIGDFYVSLGMREVERNDNVVIIELRGGTHMVVTKGEATSDAGFDLMVDDVDATHAEWTARGLPVSDIERGRIHDRFVVTNPAGTAVTVNSSHVVGTV